MVVSTSIQTNTAANGTSSPDHVKWLVDSKIRHKTVDGVEVEVWEFQHKNDEAVLSAWAKHFRNHYCADGAIDVLRGPRSRKDYLEQIKFPCKTSALGPSVRAGDFGEILVADYLEWILGFTVPRVRWDHKVVRDESSKGSDVIGYRFRNDKGHSADDVLAVFESKTKFSPGSANNRLQDAIIDSAKDHLRIDESLNYIKQRLLDKGDQQEALRVERFQNPVDNPYEEVFGAAALYSKDHFDAKDPSGTDCRTHPKRNKLRLIVITGTDMMSLAHELYGRAADEA